jgi:hypothetical protein
VSLQPVSRLFVVGDVSIIALAAILQMNGYSAKFYTSPLEALTAARVPRLTRVLVNFAHGVINEDHARRPKVR